MYVSNLSLKWVVNAAAKIAVKTAATMALDKTESGVAWVIE